MISWYRVAMRMIGIDYGTKRVGVAVSDPSGKFAIPFSTLANSPKLAAEIVGIARENGAKEIVIGESKKYDMTANQIMPDVMALKKELEGKGFTVSLEPEFMTSAQAERLQGKNDKIDASAAALILQSYLDRQGNA